MQKILIIYTGGTIGMQTDPKTGALRPVNFEEVRHQMPELLQLNNHTEFHSFSKPIDSSNMTPEVWQDLALLIEKSYTDYDGFVILHGSDTMAFTASALSFMFEGLSKPIVLTGSQLPAGSIRTDANKNLITAIEIAATQEQGQALVPEVSIYFDYQLFRGNRAVKYNAHNFEAFRSPNYPLLAEAGITLDFFKGNILPRDNSPFKVSKAIDNSINVLKLYPGIASLAVKNILRSPVKAIVLESFGAGNTCSQEWFLQEIKSAISEGKLILNRTQCVEGSVRMGWYETSATLLDLGVVNGHDMTFEASITKLMHVLATTKEVTQLRQILSTSLRGELSEK